MGRKRKTWFAILGLLNWKPMSGYDIKRLVEMALSHFWSESYGNLFPTLNALVEEGLATKRTDPASGARQRQVYTITSKGRRAFKKWLREPASPVQMRNELQLKFFLTSRGSIDDSIRLLEEYRAQQKQRYAEFKESEVMLKQAVRTDVMPDDIQPIMGKIAERSNELLIFFLTLRHGILTIEARMAWIDEALRALRARKRNRRSTR
jgi:DNA-binding PadR family transcriptional regulator